MLLLATCATVNYYQLMANSIRQFESLDLVSNPMQIRDVDFMQIYNARPDLSNWNDTIQRMSNAHDRLYSPVSPEITGSLTNINNYFIEAVNWFQGKAATANFVGIPQQGSLQAITQDAFNQFKDSWLPNFESNINNDQTFVMYEQVKKQVTAQVEKIGSIRVDKELHVVIKSFEAKVDKKEKSFNDFLSEKETETIGKIKRAKALEEWVKYYSLVETDYTILIEGSHRLKWQSLREKHADSPDFKKWRKPIDIVRRVTEENCSEKGFKFGEARKRALWFSVLAISVLVPACMGIFFGDKLPGGAVNPFFVDVNDDNLNLGTELYQKLKYLPLVLIPLFGYAFTNKNYRIFSNLREQYRHRKTVSVTLEGIIAGIDEKEKNTDIRVKLVEIGAKAMFDLKTIGHLSKRDSESSPMAEIVQTILPSK